MNSPPSSSPKSGTALARVWVGLLVFYLLALALNASALHRNNERLPYGPVRSLWVTVTAPLAAAAERLHWDRPRATLEDTVGAALNP